MSRAGPRAGTRAAGQPVPLVVPAILIFTSCASILSTDLYSPSLPHLPAVFATDAESVQLTMSVNLLGFTLGQLLLGPLSDRFGRRPVLLLAMAAFLATSVACGLAQSIEQLILARALQGLAACAEAVVILAIIRDLYDEADGVKILSAYGMVVAIAPAVGPVIGGHVHVLAGWRANFFLLAAILVLVIALLWRFLPETTTPDPRALAPRALARQYARLLGQRAFLAYAGIAGAGLGGIFAFVTAGPFLLIDRWGVATEHFGYYQAAIVAAFFLGSLAAGRGINRFGLDRLLSVGLVLILVGAASLPAILWLGLESAASITLAVAFFGLADGFIFATAPIRALRAAQSSGGTAAAILGMMEMGGGALGALAVGLLHDGTSWPLAIALAGCGLLVLGCYLVVARRAGRVSRSS